MRKWQSPGVRFNRHRFGRALKLRRSIIPHILAAGTRPPRAPGEKGPQRWVSLTDDLDDVLYAALDREMRIEKKRRKANTANKKGKS